MYTKKALNIQFVVWNRGEMVKRKQGVVYYGLKKREVIVYVIVAQNSIGKMHTARCEGRPKRLI